MEKNLLPSIIVLVTINVMDSLLSAVLGPTLIFYVMSLGGGKEDYGRMLSIASLSSMIMMPAYGKWVDSNGGKYHQPYMACFVMGMISSLSYFGAILLPLGSFAMYTMLFSFFLNGASNAGRTLAYSWVASMIPRDEQRNVLTFLSMSRMFGNIAGPLLNILVSKVDTEIVILGTTVPLNPYNSVGLLLFSGEVLLASATMMLLLEPSKPEPNNEENHRGSVTSITTVSESKGIIFALGHFDIFLPVYTMFAMACAFTLMGTGFPPVAAIVGYDPVEISEINAINAAVIAIAMVVSMTISMKKGISDTTMISIGVTGLVIGSASMYFFWTIGVTDMNFTIPIFVLSAGYPFIGPANRSRFTQAVHARKELEGSQGVMLAIINQAYAFAAFVSPTIIATFVIRSPESLATGSHDHYLTVGALCVPGLCVLIFVGLLYSSYFNKTKDSIGTEEGVVSESSALVGQGKKAPRASMAQISDQFSVYSESQRRLSVEVMGIPNPFETKAEEELSQRLLKDKKALEELERLDRMEDEKDQSI